VLLNLQNEPVAALVLELHLERVVDRGQVAAEHDFHHHALNLLDAPDVLVLCVAALLLGLCSGFQVPRSPCEKSVRTRPSRVLPL
jgi:hypothetical protein